MEIIDETGIELQINHVQPSIMTWRSPLTPIWLCMIRVTPRKASMRGKSLDDVAKAAPVIGTREAERRRSKDQWYAPWERDGGGKGVGSFTVPL